MSADGSPDKHEGYALILSEDRNTLGLIVSELACGTDLTVVGCGLTTALMRCIADMKNVHGLLRGILIDVEREGHSICSDIRRLGCRVPIVMITTMSDARDSRGYCDADWLLSRPVRVKEVAARFLAAIKLADEVKIEGRSVFH